MVDKLGCLPGLSPCNDSCAIGIETRGHNVLYWNSIGILNTNVHISTPINMRLIRLKIDEMAL